MITVTATILLTPENLATTLSLLEAVNQCVYE